MQIICIECEKKQLEEIKQLKEDSKREPNKDLEWIAFKGSVMND